MNAKLSKHVFWHCHENGLIKTILILMTFFYFNRTPSISAHLQVLRARIGRWERGGLQCGGESRLVLRRSVVLWNSGILDQCHHSDGPRQKVHQNGVQTHLLIAANG